MWLQIIPVEPDEIQVIPVQGIAEVVPEITIHLIQNVQATVEPTTILVTEVIPDRAIAEVIIVHHHHRADPILLVQEEVHLDSEAVHLV